MTIVFSAYLIFSVLFLSYSGPLHVLYSLVILLEDWSYRQKKKTLYLIFTWTFYFDKKIIDFIEITTIDQDLVKDWRETISEKENDIGTEFGFKSQFPNIYTQSEAIFEAMRISQVKRTEDPERERDLYNNDLLWILALPQSITLHWSHYEPVLTSADRKMTRLTAI